MLTDLGCLAARRPVPLDASRHAGVACLPWPAWRVLRTPPGPGDLPDIRNAPSFGDGCVVNMAGPCVLAFVPRFVDPGRATLPRFLAPGAVIAAGEFAASGAVGARSGRIARLAAWTPWDGRALRILSASVFAALALRLVPEGRRT